MSSTSPLNPIEEQPYYNLSHKQLGKALMSSLKDRCILPSLRNEIGYFNMHIRHSYTNLDKGILEKALYALVSRHENLRTVFVRVAGEIKQRIISAEECMHRFLYFDMSTEAAAHERAEQVAGQLIATEFDFFEGPPFIGAHIQVTDLDAVVVLVVNHIAFDFYSARTIEAELKVLYEAFENNTTIDLKPLTVQIKDFAAWEKSLVSDESENGLGRVWAKRLQHNVPTYVLKNFYRDARSIKYDCTYSEHLKAEVEKNFVGVSPEEIDRLTGVVHRASSFEGASYRFVLTNDVCIPLKAIGLRARSTLFGVFTALFFIMLYRLSGIRKLVIGLEGAVRDKEELQGVVGWLANTVLLRGNLDASLTVDAFINTVFREIASAAKYKAYPFERVLAQLQTPLDAIGALYLNYMTYGSDHDAQIVDFAPKHRVNDLPYFDLDCFLTQFQNGIEVVFRYKTDLFDADQIVYFTQVFTEIITEVISPREDSLLLSYFEPVVKPGPEVVEV
jgi:hypothetical protein